MKNNEYSKINGKFISAKNYVEVRQWLVFPLVVNKKNPAIPTSFKAASKDANQITEWWGGDQQYNIGIPTGSASGFFVIDIDEKNGVSGSDSLSKLESKYGSLPPTLHSRTGTGGRHIFFKYPHNLEVRNRAAIFPGVDVRGEGGYIVAAPSIVDGNAYEWIDEDVTIADAPKWLLTLIAPVKNVKRAQLDKAAVILEGGRNDKIFRFVVGQVRSGYSREKVESFALHANQTMCSPPMTEQEVLQIVENAFRLSKDNYGFKLSDLGNSKKMADINGHDIRYLFESASWLLWNQVYWEPVSIVVIMGLAKQVPAALAKEAEALPDGPAKTALMRHARSSESRKRLVDMVDLFKSEPGIGISVAELDQHPFLFPVQNGIVNLKNGTFLPPDRELLLTQIAGVSFDAVATCPRWLNFVSQTMGKDPALMLYMQRAIGYALTGSLAEQCLFFLYGFGANGKSTFLNVIRALFGTLGLQAASETLMDGKRSSGGPSGDIARLRGKRFVSMSETDDGRHMNEGLVKSLTGGDPVVARDLYQSTIEFLPTHKLFLASNHKPIIKGTDIGVWRRIRMVPFNVTVKPEDRNPNLEAELLEELPGILNWAIEGCLDWQRNGLPMPKAIEVATNEYKSEMDIVGSWISECCEVGPWNEVVFDDAYRSYEAWSKDYNGFAFTKKRFGQMLLERGFKQGIKNRSRSYKGISLSSEISKIIENSLKDSEEF